MLGDGFRVILTQVRNSAVKGQEEKKTFKKKNDLNKSQPQIEAVYFSAVVSFLSFRLTCCAVLSVITSARAVTFIAVCSERCAHTSVLARL